MFSGIKVPSESVLMFLGIAGGLFKTFELAVFVYYFEKAHLKGSIRSYLIYHSIAIATAALLFSGYSVLVISRVDGFFVGLAISFLLCSFCLISVLSTTYDAFQRKLHSLCTFVCFAISLLVIVCLSLVNTRNDQTILGSLATIACLVSHYIPLLSMISSWRSGRVINLLPYSSTFKILSCIFYISYGALLRDPWVLWSMILTTVVGIGELLVVFLVMQFHKSRLAKLIQSLKPYNETAQTHVHLDPITLFDREVNAGIPVDIQARPGSRVLSNTSFDSIYPRRNRRKSTKTPHTLSSTTHKVHTTYHTAEFEAFIEARESYESDMSEEDIYRVPWETPNMEPERIGHHGYSNSVNSRLPEELFPPARAPYHNPRDPTQQRMDYAVSKPPLPNASTTSRQRAQGSIGPVGAYAPQRSTTRTIRPPSLANVYSIAEEPDASDIFFTKNQSNSKQKVDMKDSARKTTALPKDNPSRQYSNQSTSKVKSAQPSNPKGKGRSRGDREQLLDLAFPIDDGQYVGYSNQGYGMGPTSVHSSHQHHRTNDSDDFAFLTAHQRDSTTITINSLSPHGRDDYYSNPYRH